MGGAYDEYLKYQSFYTIHYEMIKYACENGYSKYNFYAINNHLDKDDEQYGVYEFKTGFGGHVMELLGEFILPVDIPLYYAIECARKVKRIIKK